MNNILKFISRNAVWVAIGTLALMLFGPAVQELKTLLLIIAVEALALGLSGIAVRNLGFIFLGVHLCVGLVVLGVYLAQF